MDNILIHPLYFGPISQYVAICNSSSLVFETCDNFQKQTYRNRTYIYGANGKLLLNIPVLHTGEKGSKRLTKDIQIEYQFHSLKNHWKSLQAAYRSSPYFEFYEDELAVIFESKPKFLLDLNFKCTAFVFECIQQQIKTTKTTSYETEPTNIKDFRFLTNAKNKDVGANFTNYIQVFKEKNGFLPNLSILDLLFNEGPNAFDYLKMQKLQIPEDTLLKNNALQ